MSVQVLMAAVSYGAFKLTSSARMPTAALTCFTVVTLSLLACPAVEDRFVWMAVHALHLTHDLNAHVRVMYERVVWPQILCLAVVMLCYCAHNYDEPHAFWFLVRHEALNTLSRARSSRTWKWLCYASQLRFMHAAVVWFAWKRVFGVSCLVYGLLFMPWRTWTVYTKMKALRVKQH